MAQIKMDISEYEALKKIQVELEKSRDDQKNLHEELEKVRKEKIEALEQAQSKIVLEERITRSEYRKPITDDEGIARAIHNFYRADRERRRYTSSDPKYSEAQNLFNHLFQSEWVESVNEDKTITVIGLDEAKRFIKDKMEKKYGEDLKYARERVELVTEEFRKEAIQVEKGYEEELKEKDELLERQSAAIQSYIKVNKDRNKVIQSLKSRGVNILNYRKVFNSLVKNM